MADGSNGWAQWRQRAGFRWKINKLRSDCSVASPLRTWACDHEWDAQS
ncbi:hypothetical protein BV133_3248 [Blastochloris viridis]|uniref:Uncharacterized protein n=1 Tax=Blastochloris viridis TaxID=1079 RepID=A0A182D757_BLAVI|nr:hypothetical protein BV133_3248 [Blastochloris viridis]